MSRFYYVDETDGYIWDYEPGNSHPCRMFTDFNKASTYRDMVRQRLNSQSQGGSVSSSNSMTADALVQLVIFPFLLVFKILKFIFSHIFVILPVLWVWAFAKRVSITKRIIGLIFFLFILGVLAFGAYYLYSLKFKIRGYVTTKCPVSEYSKREREPSGKEIGKIKTDDVLNLRTVHKTKNVTWLSVYKLVDNVAEETWVLIPDVIDVKTENKFLLFNEKSRTWNNYFAKIDAENEKILKDCHNHFFEATKNIEVTHSNDNVLKESIGSTKFILPKKGYLGLYVAENDDFYFIAKENKKAFLKSVNNMQREFYERSIHYYPRHKK